MFRVTVERAREADDEYEALEDDVSIFAAEDGDLRITIAAERTIIYARGQWCKVHSERLS